MSRAERNSKFQDFEAILRKRVIFFWEKLPRAGRICLKVNLTDILLGEIVQIWEKFQILDFEAILRTRVISPGRIYPELGELCSKAKMTDILLGEIDQSWEKLFRAGRNCPELGEIPNFGILKLSLGPESFSPGINYPELGEFHFKAKLADILLGEIVQSWEKFQILMFLSYP